MRTCISVLQTCVNIPYAAENMLCTATFTSTYIRIYIRRFKPDHFQQNCEILFLKICLNFLGKILVPLKCILHSKMTKYGFKVALLGMTSKAITVTVYFRRISVRP